MAAIITTTTALVRAAFHGAAYVHVDEKRDLAIVWSGGTSFSAYATPGLARVDGWVASGGVSDRWDALQQCERWLTNL